VPVNKVFNIHATNDVPTAVIHYYWRSVNIHKLYQLMVSNMT